MQHFFFLSVQKTVQSALHSVDGDCPCQHAHALHRRGNIMFNHAIKSDKTHQWKIMTSIKYIKKAITLRTVTGIISR